MNRNQTSLTARGIAFMRALESEKPAGERICYDPLAIHFTGRAFFQFMKLFTRTGYAERRGPGVMGFLVARARYIDDYLMASLDQGIAQLVILGAGYDSRAYRIDGLKGRAVVFEVDLPATQRQKKAVLERVLGCLPDHVAYVPVDFNTDTLARLFDYGYARTLKTLFIWEGVTYYISAAAVDSTLAFVAANSAAGSTIIFDYTFPEVADGTLKRNEATSMRRYERFTGEAIRFGIPRGAIESFLRERGFDDVVNAGSDELQALYFTGINQKRAVAPVYAIAHAVVAPRIA